MMDKWTQQINRIISIALVISLLFAGMYVDIVPAEDLFVYDMTGKAAASLAPAQSDTNNDAICTAELPAVQNADLQSRTSYQQQYRETNEFRLFAMLWIPVFITWKLLYTPYNNLFVLSDADRTAHGIYVSVRWKKANLKLYLWKSVKYHYNNSFRKKVNIC